MTVPPATQFELFDDFDGGVHKYWQQIDASVQGQRLHFPEFKAYLNGESDRTVWHINGSSANLRTDRSPIFELSPGPNTDESMLKELLFNAVTTFWVVDRTFAEGQHVSTRLDTESIKL